MIALALASAAAHAAPLPEGVLARVHGGEGEYLRGPVDLADVDGDGASDLVVANWQGSAYYFGTGEAFVYAGVPAGVTSTSEAARTVYGATEHDYVGTGVAVLTRPTGTWLAVGAEHSGLTEGEAGQLLFLADPLAGRGRVAADDVSAVVVGAERRDRLGAHVLAEDLDGDGVDELLAAAPGADGGAGTLWILGGDAPIQRGAIATEATARIDGGLAGSFAGWQVATGGDLDGDGVSDLLVGSLDPAVPWGGRVHRFDRVPDGATLTLAGAADTWHAPAADCWLGYGLALGDTDGDGTDDAWASAPFGCDDAVGEGLAWRLPPGGGTLTTAEADARGAWNEGWGTSIAALDGTLLVGAPGAGRVDLLGGDGVVRSIHGTGELGAWVGAWADPAGPRAALVAPSLSLDGDVTGAAWLLDPSRVPAEGLVLDEALAPEDTTLPPPEAAWRCATRDAPGALLLGGLGAALLRRRRS